MVSQKTARLANVSRLPFVSSNEGLNHDTYTADVRSALAHLFNNTRNDDGCKEWGEINELKYLFRTSQPWTREQAHKFLSAAWDYIGFE